MKKNKKKAIDNTIAQFQTNRAKSKRNHKIKTPNVVEKVHKRRARRKFRKFVTGLAFLLAVAMIGAGIYAASLPEKPEAPAPAEPTVPETYNVTYVLDGGVNAEGNPATYTEGGATVTLNAPTKKGYTFTGWAEGDKIERGATGDKTFTATWAAETYTIVYNLGGGSFAEEAPATYTVEDEVVIPAPTKTGYTFAGWIGGVDGIEKGSTGKKTFTASWTVNTYTITYVLDGGEIASDAKTTYTVKDAFELATPTKAGYRFLGWTEGNAIELGSTGDKTFTANWEEIME